MEFKDLKVGDSVYILENAGTFRKINTYNIGTILQIGVPYEDNTINNPYLSPQFKKKLVDITVGCEGAQKKLTVGADKTTITDSTIGLTISTGKEELVTQLNNQCKEYEQKISAIEFYKQELQKCQQMLNSLTQEEERMDKTDTIKVS